MRRHIFGMTAVLALAAAASAQDATGPSSTVVARTGTTATGQPISLPQGPVELVVSITEIPPGARLPVHKHPWPRYAYVERGRLRVSWDAAGLSREFGPGDAIVEAVDEWHEAEAIGDEMVRLVVIDQVPPGEINMVRR